MTDISLCEMFFFSLSWSEEESTDCRPYQSIKCPCDVGHRKNYGSKTKKNVKSIGSTISEPFFCKGKVSRDSLDSFTIDNDQETSSEEKEEVDEAHGSESLKSFGSLGKGEEYQDDQDYQDLQEGTERILKR